MLNDGICAGNAKAESGALAKAIETGSVTAIAGAISTAAVGQGYSANTEVLAATIPGAPAPGTPAPDAAAPAK